MNKIARFVKENRKKAGLMQEDLQYGPDWDFGLYGNYNRERKHFEWTW